MRLDEAAPRTWLLAAVAGWAVAAWLLAVSGMGGRIEPLPEDPGARQPLPRPGAPASERLGPLAQYDEIGARPLFTTDRRPQPFSLLSPEEGEPAQTFEYVLTGVLQTPTLQMAIVQQSGGGGEPQRLKVGESPAGASAWRLVAVHPRSAVFDGPEGEQVLDMRVWDGVGGTPPTVVQAPAPTPPDSVSEARAGADTATDADAAAGRDQAPADMVMEADAPPADAPADDEASAAEAAEDDPEARMEQIRKRIEARRAQLRREAQQTPPQDEMDTPDPSMSPPTR